jgi:hypothetical protein
MICPYFIETPLIPAGGRVLLAGAAFGQSEDVVDAGTRLMSDESIVGRALVIGPKVKVNDEWELLPANSNKQEIATWEAYAHDYEEVGMLALIFCSLTFADCGRCVHGEAREDAQSSRASERLDWIFLGHCESCFVWHWPEEVRVVQYSRRSLRVRNLGHKIW